MSGHVAAPVAKPSVNPSRIFLCAAALLPLMSLPQIYIAHGFYLPLLSDICMLPVAIVDSFKLIIHESGHLAAQWLFAQPAILRLYPEAGTGITQFAPRNLLLLAAIYLCFAAAGAWLFKKKDSRRLRILGIVVLLHSLFAATVLHRAFGMCMGHGAEMLAGMGFAWLCLFRGDRWLMPATPLLNAFARISGAAMGIYLIWENMMYMIPLMLDMQQPVEFSPVSGKQAISDIMLAARMLGTTIPAVATLLFLIGGGCIGFIGYRALKRNAT